MNNNAALYNQFLHAMYTGEPSHFDIQAMNAYTGNLKATASRAIQISYPTLLSLVGDAFIEGLAYQYLLAHPFHQGDWALWSEYLSTFIAAENIAPDHAYLSDVAALDWAIHMAERQVNEESHPHTFALLGQSDVGSLTCQLSRTATVIESHYPIVDIYNWQNIAEQEQNKTLHKDNAIEKLTHGVGQQALIFRAQYKANVIPISQSEAAFFKAIAKNVSLAEALALAQSTWDEATNKDKPFDLETWLQFAVSHKILLAVSPTQASHQPESKTRY